MHEPVLLSEVLKYLSPKKGESYVDMTAGGGGHAAAILEYTKSYQSSVLVDRDRTAVGKLRQKFANRGVKIMYHDFYEAAELLANKGVKFDMLFADLGLSSLHLNTASRGFSFLHSGPLDMRMDQRQQLTANKIVNEWEADELERILREYGEEPEARKIAASIVASRPLKTTVELAEAVTRVTTKWQRKHPATRTFQAIRLAVNSELELLKKALPVWLALTQPGGRIGIITFHSLEDRIVKRFFAEHSANSFEKDLNLLFKHPVTPGRHEVVYNPRSRSAKLRVAVKIKTTERTSDAN
ncbi:16S rRNA (cytosine(1402)-N(4))-methyltransferase RsmH [Candidatus Saccharibacteria bacterium]|nr:16S rRNA (cytosine(1402)-N(4))-methyltransferase RsmH [Candidatus Saccharibacteria bacterium]HOR23192.1 16S rRNA (cytosine(1402)-N(4))-methyltransferase RsmH [Candidatus Saccharibacteria bacterium]